MSFFSSAPRRKSKQARINALKAKIEKANRKKQQDAELESLRKKWQNMKK